MRIIGVDPGTATTGFGIIDYDRGQCRFVDAGVITTPPGQPMPGRLVTLHEELAQVIAEAGLHVAEFTPMQIKQAVTGYGGAKKPQMQAMVGALLGLPAIPQDDAADALAIAIALAHSS
jgi:crossover junction endodeoxyribonuclease RuvC